MSQPRVAGRRQTSRVRGSWRALCLAVCAWALAGCSGSAGGTGTDEPLPKADGAATGKSDRGGGAGSSPDGSAASPGGVAADPATNGGGEQGTTSGLGVPAGGGEVSGGAASGGSVAAGASCDEPDASPGVLRRLTRLEYQLTLKELFELPNIPPLSTLPADSDYHGFRTLAALQNVTTEHLRAYQREVEALAEALLEDPERSARVIGCDPSAAGCLEEFIIDFGRLAYRRSLEPEEVESLLALAAEVGGAGKQQVVTLFSAMLSSASFLFRLEVGDASEGLSRLSGEELASRLSFTLIGRGPSRELLDLGANGGLDTPEGLANAARELLADPRSREFFDAFFRQWLGYEQLLTPKEPPPGWNDAVLLSMQEETDRFLSEYAWGDGMNFLDALTANHSYMRADLAEFYGLPAPAADGYVEFPEGHHRQASGLLTHASLISAKGDGDSIAHRGAWVQRTFLCINLQVPAALLDSLSDELSGLTYQQMLDRRNSDASCAGCHALIDPIGVGFAAFDKSGHFDPEVDIDQYGITPQLPGGTERFDSIGELAAQLRGRAEVASCLSQKLFLYTAGRQVAAADRCAVQQATQRFADDQYRFASVLEGLVMAPQFRMRRVPSEALPGQEVAAAQGEN